MCYDCQNNLKVLPPNHHPEREDGNIGHFASTLTRATIMIKHDYREEVVRLFLSSVEASPHECTKNRTDRARSDMSGEVG